KDPRAEISVAEMKKQFDFVNTVNKTVNGAHDAIENIRDINKKLSDFEYNYGELDETKDLLAQVKLLKSELSKIEKVLYQTQNKSNQDPLNFPIRLTNKLGHLNRLVTTNDFPPTAQDEAVRLELTKKIEEQMTHYNKLISDDLEAFNSAFAKLNLDYLTLK
ncbi:MAG: glycosyl hydrolase, partial [Flavobacteriaceae bacterium]|nr:glycosyl hydrolase [Flavobacteriaceae bacterium]